MTFIVYDHHILRAASAGTDVGPDPSTITFSRTRKFPPLNLLSLHTYYNNGWLLLLMTRFANNISGVKLFHYLLKLKKIKKIIIKRRTLVVFRLDFCLVVHNNFAQVELINLTIEAFRLSEKKCHKDYTSTASWIIDFFFYHV